MPDDVEQEHDKIMKKKHKINDLDQIALLFHFTIKNNFKAVQWIRFNTNTRTGIMNKSPEWAICPCMIAIHNKNPELACFLIETNKKYNNNWKFYYNNIIIPETLQNYLYPHGNRNFSFLFYFIAVLTDNTHDLKKLYAQQIPSKEGQEFLISEAKWINSTDCLKILSKTKNEKKADNYLQTGTVCIIL